MQPYDQERHFHRRMHRYDLLRAVVAGVLIALCIIVSAYVGLSAGLWIGMGAFFLFGAFLAFTHKKMQNPVTEKLTVPALQKAFDQPCLLPAVQPPKEEIALFFPTGVKTKWTNQLTASWNGLSFTFANVLVKDQARRTPVFHGQWLVIRTDWSFPGRVAVKERDVRLTEAALPPNTQLPAVNNEFLRAYQVDTDSPVKAAAILANPLMQALLMQCPCTHLLVEDATVHLAIPSDEPFFALTGLEETSAQVQLNNQRQIDMIHAWLDSILSIDLPDPE